MPAASRGARGGRILWCGRGDLNPHAFRRHPLKMVCLPVPPLPQESKHDYNKRPKRAQYFTIAANDLGSRLAPPTSAPSISFSAIKAFALSGFTDPPYKILRLFPNSSPNALDASARISV